MNGLRIGCESLWVLLVGTAAVLAAPPEALAQEPAPAILAAQTRFRDAGFGLFIHWGVYSVLGDGEWVLHERKMSLAEYEKLPGQFNPVHFDPAEWVRIAKAGGMRYITITSKHHDGFAMWDSKVSDWDIVDRTPYGRDVLKMLAEECQRQQMPLFFYHSHLDWRHPDYFPRGRTGQHTGRPDAGRFDQYLDYLDAQLTELCSGRYGSIAGIWFDGWWDQQDQTAGAPPHRTLVDWRLARTYDLIHRLQPQALVGNNHHVAPFPGEDFQMFERDLPGQNAAGFNAQATIGNLPLESCDTINGSWGYRASDQNWKSVRELVHYLVRAAGNDANFLLNVGPLPDGRFPPEAVERLRGMGQWLARYGESIYGTRRGPVAPQSWGVSTRNDRRVYLHVLSGGAEPEIRLTGTGELQFQQARWFGQDTPLEIRRNADGELLLEIPPAMRSEFDVILVVE